MLRDKMAPEENEEVSRKLSEMTPEEMEEFGRKARELLARERNMEQPKLPPPIPIWPPNLRSEDTGRWRRSEGKVMSDNLTTALRVNATRQRGNPCSPRATIGYVSHRGKSTSHCWRNQHRVLPTEYAYIAGVRIRRRDRLESDDHDCRSRKCNDRVLPRLGIRYVARMHFNARDRRNCYRFGNLASYTRRLASS
jgi:hypothetical protein